MLSSAKSYEVVSKIMEENVSESEESKDPPNDLHCHESLLTNSNLSDDVETPDAQVVNSDVSKTASSFSDEPIPEDFRKTRDINSGEEEFNGNHTMIGTNEKTNENLTSVSGLPPEFSKPSSVSNEFPPAKKIHSSSPGGSSENLLGSNHRRDPSLESDSDEVFPLVARKANSSDDLLDKNFVKWASGGENSLKGKRDKEGGQSSDSPISDVEFSACSSVTSCTEDSGISSTVRDDELEEIPLNNSRFSPELYEQMSRLSLDESVAAWIPKSSNTYAPSPNAKTGTDVDGSSSQKQSKLK